MTGFAKRISGKISKLSPEQVVKLVDNIVDENEGLYSILESLNTGLLICDNHWNLLQTNKAAERYIPLKTRGNDNRYAENDEPVWTLIEDEDISLFIESCFLREKCYADEEFTISTSDGNTRIITVSLQPLVQKQRFAGVIIKIDDITEKRNQDVLLRRMESLASLTNLAASVAHEIKNPLGSISIHIQLIQKALKKARDSDGLLPDPKFVEKYLGVVNEEIDRLNKIIVDFLFAVRPISATLAPIDINCALESFIEFISAELERKNITLSMKLLNKPPHLMLDEKLLKQVLINLAQNAIAAMPNGGTFSITTKIKNEKFLLYIGDTGIGMNEETVSRVFEPYFTTKATGTGLGLTLVYKVIKEFSGDIDVKSELGKGTVFCISLPVPQKELRLLEYTEPSSKQTNCRKNLEK